MILLTVATISAMLAEPPRKAKRPPRRATALSAAAPAGGAATYRSCAQARAAGAAPVRRGDPGYSRRLDRDGDGVACE